MATRQLKIEKYYEHQTSKTTKNLHTDVLFFEMLNAIHKNEKTNYWEKIQHSTITIYSKKFQLYKYAFLEDVISEKPH